MNYVVIVNGSEREVEIVELDADRYRLTMDGNTFDVDAQVVSDAGMSLLFDERAYSVEIDNGREGGANLLVDGHVVNVEVLDLRRMRLRKARAAAPAGPATVKSPMPGMVVALLVDEGQQVSAGDGLVVVEAMKMENELKAPKDGVVRRISCREGHSVEAGAALCVVD